MRKHDLFWGVIIIWAAMGSFSASAGLNDGLLASYPFNGSSVDDGPNGNHATVIGASLIADRFGNPNSAYHFDGDDYIETPVDANRLPLSFSVWFKADQITGEHSIVDSDVSGLWGHSLILGYANQDGNLDVQYHNSWLETGFVPAVNTWYHVVVNYSATQVEAYVDGVLAAQTPYAPPALDGGPFRLGRHNPGDPQWFVGDIDDVRFYNRVLSLSEISQIHSGSAPTSAFAGQLVVDPAGAVAPADVTFNTLIANGTGPFSYQYDFGDGGPVQAGGATTTHTYQQKGSYQARVVVTDGSNTSVELFTTVLVVDTNDLAGFQTDLTGNAAEMGQAATSGEINPILESATDSVDNSLSSLANADAATKQSTGASVQAAVDTLVGETQTKLATFSATGQISTLQLDEISGSLSNLVSNMVKNAVPVVQTTFDTLGEISGEIFTASAEILLNGTGLSVPEIESIKADANASRNFFKTSTYLLDDAVATAGITVNTGTMFDVAAVEAVAKDHVLTGQQTAALYFAVDVTNDVEQAVVSGTASDETIAGIVQDIFNAFYSGKTILSASVENVTKNILLSFDDGSYLSLLVRDISLVDDHLPPGLYDTPGGERLGISGGYALTFVSYPVFPFDFTAEVIKLGAEPALSNTGALTLDLPGNSVFTSRVGWALAQADTFQSLTTSFGITGGADPSAEAYAILVTYDTGLSQSIPPAVHALSALTRMLDSLVPSGYAVSADTGVISINGLKFKPDYLFSPLQSIDYDAIAASGGVIYGDVALEIGDFNGDGAADVLFYSDQPMGSQLLYAVQN